MSALREALPRWLLRSEIAVRRRHCPCRRSLGGGVVDRGADLFSSWWMCGNFFPDFGSEEGCIIAVR